MVNPSVEAALPELANFPLFAGKSREDLAHLSENGRVRVLAHRELLFKEGDEANEFGIVLSGGFKLFRVNNAGDDAIIYFSSPGDVLAALIMPQQSPRYPLSICSMGPSRALLVPRAVYVRHWVTRPDMVLKIQALFSSRMTQFRTLQTMQRSPLTAKIGSLLLQLLGKENPREQALLPLPITRKEIADSLGVTVESVIRTMSEWEKKGVISTMDQRITVHQPEIIIHAINNP